MKLDWTGRNPKKIGNFMPPDFNYCMQLLANELTIFGGTLFTLAE